MKAGILTMVFITLTGCASAPRKRFFIGAGVGAAAGSTSGYFLSPNEESRGLNALVFGLTGALIGGLGSLFFHDDSEIPEAKGSLAQPAAHIGTDYVAPHASENLPPFVRERLKPVVIEELREPDTISEDGTLHEPHKVYRIKQPAELFSRPIPEKGASK